MQVPIIQLDLINNKVHLVDY